MKNKIKLINDDKISTPGQSKKKENKEVSNRSEEKGEPGRPTLLTPELFSKLVKLFEEHFFIAIVAAKADIYRTRIYDWQNDREDFHSAITHAQDGWIAQQMKLLDRYAKDKRTKDWRALKYKLSIADKEFNDKKWMREEAGKGQLQALIININQSDLTTSKMEAMKLIGSSKSEKETVSLKLFNVNKKEKKKPREAKTLEEPPF